jgi:diaminopimelate decarboxylase
MSELSKTEREILAAAREPVRADAASAYHEALRSVDRELMLESASRFGTPQYFLDLDALRRRARMFADTMSARVPSAECCYAFKCNDLPALVGALRQEGFHADVSGQFELELALRMGFDRILFSGPGKTERELKLAMEHAGRVIVNLDNLDEIDLLATLTAGRTLRVGFRINTATAKGGAWWKFGFDLDELGEAIRRVDAHPGLEWAGIQFHGSWNKAPAAYVAQIERIAAWLSENVDAERLRTLRFLDVGGGFYPEDQGLLLQSEDRGVLLDMVGRRRGNRAETFGEAGIDPVGFQVTPVEPLDAFARAIGEAVRRHVMPISPDVTVYFEPGRYIATFATTILLRVMAVKSHGVIVDGGINMLGDYKLAEYSFAPVVNLSRPSTELRHSTISGSLCDPADLWGFSHYGDVLRVGDVVAVLHQGAYTFSGAWRFIKAIPAYVAAEQGELTLARAEETFEGRYAGCQI